MQVTVIPISGVPVLRRRREVSGVCVRISVISWSISKIQRPRWRAQKDDSNEPKNISTAPTKQSVTPPTLTGGYVT